jgi:hypothetical protein
MKRKIIYILEVIAIHPFTHPNRWKWEYDKLKRKYYKEF